MAKFEQEPLACHCFFCINEFCACSFIGFSNTLTLWINCSSSIQKHNIVKIRINSNELQSEIGH